MSSRSRRSSPQDEYNVIAQNIRDLDALTTLDAEGNINIDDAQDDFNIDALLSNSDHYDTPPQLTQARSHSTPPPPQRTPITIRNETLNDYDFDIPTTSTSTATRSQTTHPQTPARYYVSSKHKRLRINQERRRRRDQAQPTRPRRPRAHSRPQRIPTPPGNERIETSPDRSPPLPPTPRLPGIATFLQDRRPTPSPRRSTPSPRRPTPSPPPTPRLRRIANLPDRRPTPTPPPTPSPPPRRPTPPPTPPTPPSPPPPPPTPPPQRPNNGDDDGDGDGGDNPWPNRDDFEERYRRQPNSITEYRTVVVSYKNNNPEIHRAVRRLQVPEAQEQRLEG